MLKNINWVFIIFGATIVLILSAAFYLGAVVTCPGSIHDWTCVDPTPLGTCFIEDQQYVIPEPAQSLWREANYSLSWEEEG